MTRRPKSQDLAWIAQQDKHNSDRTNSALRRYHPRFFCFVNRTNLQVRLKDGGSPRYVLGGIKIENKESYDTDDEYINITTFINNTVLIHMESG
mmetsp:Transcript_62789/g.74308  ORF Transcript_62789/g.74308 Transcript_62789/m.74308 type:complete len:94 (+) Transcript_62789:92-373(+)